jgi:hypothetical protein
MAKKKRDEKITNKYVSEILSFDEKGITRSWRIICILLWFISSNVLLIKLAPNYFFTLIHAAKSFPA